VGINSLSISRNLELLLSIFNKYTSVLATILITKYLMLLENLKSTVQRRRKASDRTITSTLGEEVVGSTYAATIYYAT
jgi:hypothetical protein